jgi:hypothetical protein
LCLLLVFRDLLLEMTPMRSNHYCHSLDVSRHLTLALNVLGLAIHHSAIVAADKAPAACGE